MKAETQKPISISMKTTTIKFNPGNRWEMINSLRAGASKGICRKAESFDPRPYGMALLDSYPSLKDNALKSGTDSASKLLLDGIQNSSQPMCVAALLANAPIELEASQLKRLKFLIALAKSDPDLSGVFA